MPLNEFGNMDACRYQHPFSTALEKLPGQYPQWMLQSPLPCVPGPVADQPFTFVDDAAALGELAAHLSTVREFAIDLEHSSRYGAFLLRVV